MKVAYLINHLEVGGAEMMLYRLAAGIDKDKYEVYVISIWPSRPLLERLQQLKVKVYSLNLTREIFFPLALWRLVKILREIQPNILHTFLFHSNVLGRIAGKFARVPVIISSIRNVIFGGRIREGMMRVTDVFCDRTTTVCDAATRRMIDRKVVSPKKILTIYNGIDPLQMICPKNTSSAAVRNHLGIATDEIVLLSIGRLEEQKGYPYLIQAAAIMKQKHIKFKWLIAGEGMELCELERQVMQANVSSNIRFLGMRQDLPELCAVSTVFVLTSLWEGLPGVVLEAMAAGLPIVATDVGGTAELMQSGVHGFLIPPRNPTAIANAISQVISLSPTEREAMSECNRARVRDVFSLDSMVQQNTDLYDSLYLDKERRRMKWVSSSSL